MSQGWRPNLNWAGLGRSGWHLQFSRPGPAWRSSEGPGPQYRQSATRLWNSLILQRGLWIMQSIVCSRSMGLQLLNKYHDVMSHNIISILNIWCRKRRSLWNVQPKLKSRKKIAFFLLETTLVCLGASPDIIGKISWPLKEAILEAQTFPLNLIKSDSNLLGALESSFLDQYASVLPFRKALDIQLLDFESLKTSEVIRGRQRPLKMKKKVFITFFD